jgi:hypothetical protein
LSGGNRASLVAAIAVAIAAVACSVAPQSGASASPSAAQSTATMTAAASQAASPSAGAPKRGTLTLLPETGRYPLPGQGQSDNVYLFHDVALWSWAPWLPDRPRATAGIGQITELTPATGATRVVYRAAAEGTSVAMKASHDWLFWQESADPFGHRDARLYAMARIGGAPILIDDVARHPDLGGLIHWCIDGADIYWTLPLRDADGSQHGLLMHRRLPDGPTETLVTAPRGAIVSMPSAHGGIVAYAVAWDSRPTQVFFRLTDGSVHEIAASPAAAPAVGNGYVAFMQPVGGVDVVSALLLTESRIVDLSVGSAPRAYGDWLSWGSETRDPLDPDPSPYFIARPLSGCVARFKPRVGESQLAAIPALSNGHAAWVLRDNSQLDQKGQQLSVVLQDLEGPRCD